MANNNHFELTLDTLAPSGSITRPAQYMKANGNCSISKGDATFMYVWFDTTSESTLPTNLEPITAATSYTTQFSTNGIYYYHLVLMDEVNNKSQVYTTEAITFDTAKPTVSNVSIAAGAATLTSRTTNVKFNFSDTLSGVKTFRIYGDVSAEVTGTFTADEITTGSVTKAVTLSGTGNEDVVKTVYVTVTDNAGNTSSVGSDTITLDTEFLTGSINIRDTADTKNLNSTWVNFQDILIKLTLAQTDCVGYKIWGDINTTGAGTATAEPASFTSISAGTAISLTTKLTSGDSSSKTIHAKVIDDAGNITTLTDVIVKYDASKPTVSISPNKTIVSNQTGYDSVVFTPTINANISGVKTCTLYMDNATTGQVWNGSAPSSITVKAADMGNAGAHKFKLIVLDNAGNSTTSTEVTITKDTTGPSGTVTMSGWANATTFETLGATASATDSSGVSFMTCWCSTTANDTTVPATATEINYSVNPTHSQIDWTGSREASTNYIHIKYKDSVGNTTIVHSGAFGIDKTAPAKATISFASGVYNTTTAVLNISSSDSTSGLSQMCITGPVTGSGTWENYATSKTVTLTGNDGLKYVKIKVKDIAGNISVDSDEAVTELDRTKPSAWIGLYEADGTTAKAAYSNQASFTVRIAGHDDAGTPYSDTGLSYKLYGDFNTVNNSEQGTTEPTGWTTLKFDSGKTYKTISGLYATKDTSTEGNGTLKEIYLKIKDNAGNISEGTVKVSFTYDASAPEVVVSGVDHNRISKVHAYRKSISNGTISESTKYSDETYFTFTPTVYIKAYKVCAYKDTAAAKTGSCNDAAIPTANGSINMTGTGLNSNASVTAKINGIDYETALGRTITSGTKDGAHIVVVYVQNLGGTWSTAAEFSV